LLHLIIGFASVFRRAARWGVAACQQ